MRILLIIVERLEYAEMIESRMNNELVVDEKGILNLRSVGSDRMDSLIVRNDG